MLSKSRIGIAARTVARRLLVESLENRLMLAAQPTVGTVTPAAGATGVALNMPVTAALNLPNGGIDPTTVTNATLTLTQTSNGTAIPAVVNTTGGGDALILTPSINLAINTNYTLTATAGIKDVNGDALVAFTETFTTGSTLPPINQSIAFQKVPLPTTQGTPFTDMQIGPDGLLYASTEDGRIFRYVMNADGTLGKPQIITSLQAFEGNVKRLITGFAFDPASTVTNPIIWVSNTFYALTGATNGQNFTSKLTVMSGPDLATVTDAVINLPRSVADHVNDQPVFQPGTTNLFFCQAAENAFGAPDTTWGNRPETLLSAAILEVNTAALNLSGPALNVLTPDAKSDAGVLLGGTYNPYAAGAALTIYATGVRNAYPLFFDSQGQLWASVNGSSSGGNTPAFPNAANGNRIDTGQPYNGPAVPALTNIQQTEEDVMDKIVKGGYYGHPDPARGEFVLDDGNPTAGGVPGLAFTAYPLGTNPDPNYRQPNFVFGLHNSPDAIVQYTGNAFGGALNGKLLVTEYSAGDDIVTLSRDSNDNITSADRTISGFNGFVNPLALIENPATGFLYVSEIGSNRLTLLKPASVTPQISASSSVVAFNTVATGDSGAGPSRTETVTITNTGANPLTFGSGAFSIVNDPTTTANAANFTITNSGSLPSSLASGASTTIKMVYTATIVGLQSALLQIKSNDPITSTLDINLHGIGTPGTFGVLEPSLVQVLRAFNIPTIIGAGPNDVNINTQKYPINPDPSSQEVPLQRLVVAGPGPVTITSLASFSSATFAISRIGYYTPGDPNSTNELFYVPKVDAQTVSPSAIGTTSFDPGSAPFGLYGTFPGTSTPGGLSSTHYSEDALNVFDPTHERKIRFFPMKTANGTVVPNSYVFAIEDFNDPTQFNSFINYVGIISNVKAAPNATAGSTPSSPTGNNPPVMGVEENQTAPGSTTLAFNTIQKPNPIMADAVHNSNTITINNTGDQPLTVSSVVLSDTTNWQIVSQPTQPIKPGQSGIIVVKFIATTVPPHNTNEINDPKSQTLVAPTQAGGVWTGTVTITSNDAINPTRTLNLAGYWQIESEHEDEPNVSTLTNLVFGYKTNTTPTDAMGNLVQQGTQYPNNGNTVVNYASEVDPSTNQGLLVAADPGQPVSLIEAAAFHQQYLTVTATVGTNEHEVVSASESGTTATITTTTANGFQMGQTVTVVGVQISTYNGTFTITSTPTTTTFTYTLATSGLATSPNVPTDATAGWYLSGGSTKVLYKDLPNNGQAMFPLLTGIGSSTFSTTFNPSGAFGLNLDGERSQDSLNAAVDAPFNTSGHAIRFFPAMDSNGNTIPNTWIVGLDYRNYLGPNSDYQDLYMILTNATFEANAPTPIDLHASEGTSGVNLQWVAMTGATGYNIYQTVNGTQVKLNSSPVAASSYVDSTAPAGSVVGYQVFAVNAAGTQSLPASASISLVGATNGQTNPGPAAPTVQSADGSSGTQVVVTWSAPMGATSYILERENPGQGSFTQIASNLTTTTFTDPNVTAGDTYQYQVAAKNAAGTSPFSTPLSATVALTPPNQPPASPTNVQESISMGTAIILTWDGSTGATSYNVLREDPGASTFSQVVSGLTDSTFTDAIVAPGQTYQYEIEAVNAAGPSSPTAPVSATLPGLTPPAAPTNVQADTSSGNSVVLTWNASAAATTYSVLREDPGSSTFLQVGTGITTTTFTDTSVVEGQSYQYEVVAQGAGGSSPDTTAITAAVPPPAASLDITIGKGANQFVKFTNNNGTLTTIRIAGRGTATVHFGADTIAQTASGKGVIVSGTNVFIAQITTTGTTAATTLTVLTKGGNKTVNIGGIVVDASLNSINAGTASLIGTISVAGSINRILLGSASATSISIGGKLGTLQLGTATGIGLTATGPVRSIIANSWTSNQSITAPSIFSINIRGDAEMNIAAGTLHSLHVRGMLHDSTVALSAAGVQNLASLVAGSIANSAIDSVGNLGSISAGTLNNSQVYAGTGLTARGAFPPISTSFPVASVIASVNLKRKAGAISDVNSSIAASLITHASLGTLLVNNGGTAFGLESTAIHSLSAVNPTTGKPFTLTGLTSASIVTADLASKGITPQDFMIDII